MFQRFASALFGDDAEELSESSTPGGGEEEEDEEDEDWILVNYLAETCSAPCGEDLPASTAGREEDEAEEDEGLVMVPSPMASPPIRYSSYASLNSTDGGAEEEEEDEEDGEKEESGFLRVDARSLQESWFVTPPPCFTGCRNPPALLETSPLENLLIEHPSMSVYALHRPHRRTLDKLPRSRDRDLDETPENKSSPPAAAGGKDPPRYAPESPRPRQEVVQRRSALHSTCYAAARSTRAGLLQPRPGHVTQRTQPLSRNALRRLNLLRPQKFSGMHLHQPSQRPLNY